MPHAQSSHHLASRSRLLLLSGASFISLLAAQPAAAQVLTAIKPNAGGTSSAGTSGAFGVAGPRVAPVGMTADQAAQKSQQATADFNKASNAVIQQLAAQAQARVIAQSAPPPTNLPAVANGLAVGGLVVDPRVAAGTDPNLWVNASAPVQTTSGDQTTVTITQTAQRAILTWQAFNVGQDTTVHFDQSAGNSSTGNSWIALNRIDATGVPSQILGQIKAEGTVMLINPNGVIFTGTSQVNVHSLVATSLDINSFANNPNLGVFNSNDGAYTPLVINGQAQLNADGSAILVPKNEDSANVGFLNSGLFFTPPVGGSSPTLLLAQGSNVQSQGIVVQAGAQITTDVSGFDNGGFVALIGPSVTNAGAISTPAGQIILAAGGNVSLIQPASGQTAYLVSNNPVLLPNGSEAALLYSASGVTGDALATNAVSGALTAARGNITLVGDSVAQLGVVEATTSITRPGSITISALGTPTTANPGLGSVVFGPQSVTAILPDENGETIPSDPTSLANFQAPTINVTAANLDVQSGALIEAPGAAMTVSNVPTAGNGASGRVLIENGATIDLAGLGGVDVSQSQMLFTFKVTANDVADTPLAQNLIGQTVTIDLSQSGTRADGATWVGSPLFSASGSGYLADIAQSIDQLLVKGGSLSIGKSGAPFNDAIFAPGSTLNLSGGWMQVQGAPVQTTRLLATDGQVYDISDADPFIPYVGYAGQTVVSHDRWGVTDTFSNGLLATTTGLQTSYVAGASAGGLSISAVNPVLEGQIIANTVEGPRQAALSEPGTGQGAGLTALDQLPLGASLSLNLSAPATGIVGDAVVLSQEAPDVLGDAPSLASPLALSNNTLVLSTDMLSAIGLQSLTINGAETLSEVAGANLTVRSGGGITLGSVTEIDGALTAHSGSISLTGINSNANPALSLDPALTVGATGLLDVSGLWINDAGNFAQGVSHPAFLNGGSVSISTFALSHNSFDGSKIVSATDATQSIVLAPGSVIDASSGGYVKPNGALLLGSDGLPVGSGGSVALSTYVNAQTGQTWVTTAGVSSSNYAASNNYAPTGVGTNGQPNEPNAASISLGGTITAAGFDNDGGLTLQAPGIQIRGDALMSGPGLNGTITLPASFFLDNGFGSYTLTSTWSGVNVAPGATVQLRQENFLAAADLTSLPTGSSLRTSGVALGLEPDGLRHAVNLALNQSPYAFDAAGAPGHDGGITLGEGASILTDPQAVITMTAGGPITILGDIVDHGGSVSLSNNFTGSLFGNASTAAQDVWIGQNAVIDVSGVFLPSPQVTTFSTGTVLNGGSVAISGGTIVTLPGSLIDIQGASATVNELTPDSGLGVSAIAPQTLWSDGGSLTLSPAGSGSNDFGALYLGGGIEAAGGAPQAAGGSLSIGVSTATATLGYGTVNISQTTDPTAGFMTTALAGGATPATQAQLAALLPSHADQAVLNADTLNKAGFDNVTILGGLTFNGSVNLSVRGSLVLDAGQILLRPQGGVAPVVNLDAGYIVLAGDNNKTAPGVGSGVLNVNASTQLDLDGLVTVSGASDVNLTSEGDIRLVALSFMSELLGLPSPNLGGPASGQQFGGAFIVPDNLTLTAHQIYPSTDTAFLLLSTGLGGASGGGAANTIAFASNGAPSAQPLSANGAIFVDADTIVQGSDLVAPLGDIQLGLGGQPLPNVFAGSGQNGVQQGLLIPNGGALPFVPLPATQSLTLAPGSVTSVSAAGLDIPYGMTVDGLTWYENSPNGPNGAPDGPGGTNALTAPPSKLITLNGVNVSTQSGAVIDASGGGDIYASEFVPGTGGSRNVLTSGPTGQTVYALVPSATAAKIAPFDPTFNATVAPGLSVTLTGGEGVPAGTYTLMPGMYATLPGALRVTAVFGTSNAMAGQNFKAPDGSIYMAGTLGNSITGTRSAQSMLFELQPASTWTRYSEIDITSGAAFFASLAATQGTVAPPLPQDAGHLVLNATSSLTLDGTNDFAPASGGRGGLVDIAASDILVLASDQAAPAADAGYLVLDADQLSNLGAASVLLGGTRSSISTGVLITPDGSNVDILTDAAHPLTGPELLFVSLAPTAPTAADRGVVVESGSVIAAKGTVAAGTDSAITIGANPVAQFSSTGVFTGFTAGVSGDGSLLRVSNGTDVAITRDFVPGQPTGVASETNSSGGVVNAPAPQGTALGNLTVASGANLSGTSLTLDTSGSTTLAPDAVLQAQDYTLSGAVVNIGATPSGQAGLTISSTLLANFAGAQSVTLHSYSVFNLYDAGGVAFGDTSNPIGTLTFDGAGLFSQGGSTAIAANNVVFTDSQATPNLAGALSGSGGVLAVNASQAVTFGAGASSFGGFRQTSFTGGQQVVFAGSGSVTAGAADVTLSAPDIVASELSSQSLTTTGAITLASGAGTAPTVAPTDAGGSLTLTGASIDDEALITALAGNLFLEATSGDVSLGSSAKIVASGTAAPLLDQVIDAPAGFVSLTSDQGNVNLAAGSVIDVSGVGTGAGGTVTITTAPSGVATLNGTLNGVTQAGAAGSTLAVDAGQISGALPNGFAGALEVQTHIGDLDIITPIASSVVSLTADGGRVMVSSTIDASGSSGGVIGLFGADGVDVQPGAKLMANATAAGQDGGSITLGSNGVWGGGFNADGSEAFTSAGLINVEAGAVLDVSAGAGGSGGVVTVRAPLLASNDVNVSFAGQVNGASAVVLDAYHVWSTTDATTGAQHFDGLIDPAGWFNSNGQMVDGVWQDLVNGAVTTIATETGGVRTAVTSGAGVGDTNTGVFVPNAVDAAHVGFYQTTLVDFVENPFGGNNAAVSAHFTSVDPSLLALRPEIVLQNPSSAINSGNVTVASNWNLGAGSTDGSGNIDLFYRTSAGQPGVVTLRAQNNVQINASISDGFFETGPGAFFVQALPPPPPPPPVETYAQAVTDWFADYSNTVAVPRLTAILQYLSAHGLTIYDLLGISSTDLATYGLDAFTPSQVSGPLAVALAATSNGSLIVPASQNATILSDFQTSLSDSSWAGNPTSVLRPLPPPDLSGQNAFAAGEYYKLFYEGYLTNYTKFWQSLPIVRSGVIYAVGNGPSPAPAHISVPSYYINFDFPVVPTLSGSNFRTYYQSYANYKDGLNSPTTLYNVFYDFFVYGANINYPREAAPVPIPASDTANAFLYLSSTAGSATSYSADYGNYVTGPGFAHEADPITVNGPGPGGTGCHQCFVPVPPAPAPSFATVNTAGLLPAPPAPPPPPPLPSLNAHPENAIANNPAFSNNGVDATVEYNTTSAASLSPLGGASFSFGFVGGADFSSANPYGVVTLAPSATASGPNAQGSVTLNGHTVYDDPQATRNIGNANVPDFVPLKIDLPTIVRTGTGSIDIAAAGSVELLDTTAPGAVYTAGAVAQNASGFTPPVANVPSGLSNGLIDTPVWAKGGGSITVSAGHDIVGIEAPVDADGSQTGAAGTLTGQFWSSWYFFAGVSTGAPGAPFNPAGGGVQPSAWINYASFFQGFGALGGGDIRLKAGADIDDVSASIPETIQVSGGQSAGGPAPQEHVFGGGNLTVQAAGDINSGLFFVGNGTGSIQAGGVIAADARNPITGAATAFTPTQLSGLLNAPTPTGPSKPLAMLLAEQDGFITVSARSGLSLGGVFDPTTLPLDVLRDQAAALPDGGASTSAPFGRTFDTYGPAGGVALASTSGDITIGADLGTASFTGLFSLFNQGSPRTSGGGLLSILPGVNDSPGGMPGTLQASALTGDVDILAPLTLAPTPEGTLTLLAGGSISTVTQGLNAQIDNAVTMLDGTTSGFVSDSGVPLPATLAAPLHADDPNPVIIEAGQDITGAFSVVKAADISAGQDIVNLDFTGMNLSPNDITSIIAGRDIVGQVVRGQSHVADNNIVLYGPGTLLLQAGRNLGPFATAANATDSSVHGVMTVGDGSNLGPSSFKSYLPQQGATIYALFGTGPGADYQAAIDAYVNPASAGANGISYLPDIATQLGVSQNQAWAAFQALPATKQHLLIDHAFLSFLTQVSEDFANPSSPFAGQYARAYDTIATLFSASLGYTDNNTGESNGASQTVHTGDLQMAHSVIETQSGGDINIIGPGGNIFVGTNSADSLKPNQQGILTLQGGTIRSFTDESVIVDQSRIFTEQGGDVDLFSANGDLNAGKGPKSSASFPPLSLICDVDGYCRVNPAGLVTGAGIGALISVPGQNPLDSNAVLTAPHGTVDAGAAGIRVAGNLILVAQVVANAFNIDVGGKAFGIPTGAVADVGANLSASNAAAAAAQEAVQAVQQSRRNDAPSVITVTIDGFGIGDDGCDPSGQKCTPR